MPRQPSVPNLIAGHRAIDRRCQLISPPCATTLHWHFLHTSFCSSLLVQILHHFAHILRVLAGSNQQGIVSLHHDQILYPDRSHEFPRSMHVVVLRVQGKDAVAGNHVAVRRPALGHVMLVQCASTSLDRSSRIPREDRKIWPAPPFGRTRLQHGVIDADIFALGIKPAKYRGKLAVPNADAISSSIGAVLGRCSRRALASVRALHRNIPLFQ